MGTAAGSASSPMTGSGPPSVGLSYRLILPTFHVEHAAWRNTSFPVVARSERGDSIHCGATGVPRRSYPTPPPPPGRRRSSTEAARDAWREGAATCSTAPASSAPAERAVSRAQLRRAYATQGRGEELPAACRALPPGPAASVDVPSGSPVSITSRPRPWVGVCRRRRELDVGAEAEQLRDRGAGARRALELGRWRMGGRVHCGSSLTPQ